MWKVWHSHILEGFFICSGKNCLFERRGFLFQLSKIREQVIDMITRLLNKYIGEQKSKNICFFSIMVISNPKTYHMKALEWSMELQMLRKILKLLLEPETIKNSLKFLYAPYLAVGVSTSFSCLLSKSISSSLVNLMTISSKEQKWKHDRCRTIAAIKSYTQMIF